MSRYDKYDPISGGFRAPIAADMLLANGFTAYGVGLNASGQVVLGAGNTGVKGVLVTHGKKTAGDIVDVMTNGECVDMALASGTVYTADTTTGVIAAVAADATHTAVGFTVEAKRLVVRKGV